MPPYGGQLSGGAVCPLRQGVASSEAEMSYLLEGGSLPSSEAEMICPLEDRFATLERGGDAGAVEGPDGSPRARRRSSREPERGANGPHAGLL